MKLTRADRVLFSTMENDRWFVFLIAVIRSWIGRHTWAIVMNVDSNLRRLTVKSFLNLMVYRVLTLLDRVHMISILPHYLNPRLTRFTNQWMYDPQYWDLAKTIERKSLPTTELSEQVVLDAGARPILIFIGSPSRRKGFDFLYDTLQSAPDLRCLLHIVVAGQSDRPYESMLDDIRRWGGTVVDRYLSDDEIISLSNQATCAWACYHPSYDSSSGICGRAMQLTSAVLVRKNSLIERIAAHLDYPVYSCSFDITEEAVEILRLMITEFQNNTFLAPSDIAFRCRQDSTDCLRGIQQVN